MTEIDSTGVSVLPVRLAHPVRAELSLLAGFDDTSLAELARTAIDEMLARRRTNGDLAKAAEAALAEVDREADTRRAELKAFLGAPEPHDAPPATKAPTKAAGRTPAARAEA